VGLRVLTCDFLNYISNDFVVESCDGLHRFHLQRNDVTHWMPLPQPPKECE
jgi:hypothetical protein